jgi:hypothetical protein
VSYFFRIVISAQPVRQLGLGHVNEGRHWSVRSPGIDIETSKMEIDTVLKRRVCMKKRSVCLGRNDFKNAVFQNSTTTP